jgi:4-hydroxy-L-threonine phosphate dehydrogenase PdxA
MGAKRFIDCVSVLIYIGQTMGKTKSEEMEMVGCKLPTVGFILGDPSGIGPEIVLKLLQAPRTYRQCRPVLIGNYVLLCRMAERIVPGLYVSKCQPSEVIAWPEFGRGVPMIDVGGMTNDVRLGCVTAAGGEIAYMSIVRTFEMLASGFISGAVMAPINKAAMDKADCGYQSEYELFADLAKVGEVQTIVKGGNVFRSSVIGHVPFREIISLLDTDRIIRTGRGLYRVMRGFGLSSPSIAVAALNPHCGEGGEFGQEEDEIITPAIVALRKEGIDARGPYPADTIHLRALRKHFNGIVHLYHDQGNIAMKTQMFESTAIIYANLPYCVLSTGHGSALDIADLCVANPTNIAYVLSTLTEMLNHHTCKESECVNGILV